LAPTALAWFQAAINFSSAAILYSDGEILDAGLPLDSHLLPHFRPAFDYDLLLQRNYIGTTFCIARKHFAELQGLQTDVAVDPWHDLLLRACERFGPGAFMHLPQILVRSPENIGAADTTVVRDRTLITVQRHLERAATGATVVPHHDPLGRGLSDAVHIVWPDDAASRIAVIIPTRDGVDMIFTHVSSLRRLAGNWDRIEIAVIVNGEIDDRTRIGFSEIERTFDNLRVVYRQTPFNWAEINNAAVSEVSAGSILLFLNDDMVCLTAGWDVRLRSQLARPDIGVVGGRLLYPNGAIQHAGIAFGAAGRTQHEAMGDIASDGLYLDRTLLVHDAGAVTGALLACRRTTFEVIGCFDAKRYEVTSSDADLCVRVRAASGRVLYDPVLTWIHYESASRGADSNDDRKRWRAEEEHAAFTSHFSEVDLLDLSVNPHLFRSGRPFEVFQRLDRNTLDLWLHAQVLRREQWRSSTGSTLAPVSG
jgi:GT2 family glycosyltransferase